MLPAAAPILYGAVFTKLCNVFFFFCFILSKYFQEPQAFTETLICSGLSRVTAAGHGCQEQINQTPLSNQFFHLLIVLPDDRMHVWFKTRIKTKFNTDLTFNLTPVEALNKQKKTTKKTLCFYLFSRFILKELWKSCSALLLGSQDVSDVWDF